MANKPRLLTPVAKMQVAKRPGPGRPTLYTPELAVKVARRVAGGDRLAEIAKDFGATRASISEWRLRHVEFADLMCRARQAQADLFIDEILDILDNDLEKAGDTVAVMVARTRIDAYKWLAVKFAPKVYGDKLGVDVEGPSVIVVRTGLPTGQPSSYEQ